MKIDKLMKKFVGLGYVMVGFGPNHPSAPNFSIQDEITKFLADHPALAKDQSYVDFLEHYSAAVVEWPDEELLRTCLKRGRRRQLG